MLASLIDSRTPKRLGELPGVGKVDTKYEGGLATICATGLRTRGHAGTGTRSLDLSSQVCTANEFNISVLMTLARPAGL